MRVIQRRVLPGSLIGLVLAAVVPVIAAAQTAAGAQANARRESAAEAWGRAVIYADESELWVAASSDITMEQLNRRGESQQAVWLKQTAIKHDDSIEVSMSIVSASAGFAARMDVSAGDAGDADRPGGPGGGSASALEGIRQHPANPFAPAVRHDVAIEATGESRTIGGANSVEYAINWSTDEGVFSGTIWLAEETHAPVRLEVTAEMVDNRVRAANLAATFETYDGLTVLARAVVHQSVRVNLFVTAHTRMTVSFEDYFKTNGTEEYIVRGLPKMEE